MATFSNVATLSYNGNTTVSNAVVGELEENLTMTKTAARDVYSANDSVTFAISLINNGNTDMTGITVTDDLGGYSYTPGGAQTATTLYPLDYSENSLKVFENGVPVNGAAVNVTSPLTITGITVPANGNTMILYEAVPNDYAPRDSGGSITNTVTASGSGIDPVLTALDTITVFDEPILTIQKALSPTVVAQNDTLTDTFIIENSGDVAATAQDGLVLSDTFDPRLSNISVTVDGTPLDASSYNYDPATGVFSTVSGALTVPAAISGRNTQTGVITSSPGVTTVTVIGTVV